MCSSDLLGFVVFVVAAFAEAARLPFDLPEAEQELIGGYHTEYSGMKLMLFLTARSEERRVGKECRSRWSPYH